MPAHDPARWDDLVLSLLLLAAGAAVAAWGLARERREGRR
jgi:hypothetical protein